jgi:hypothetical protein
MYPALSRRCPADGVNQANPRTLGRRPISILSQTETAGFCRVPMPTFVMVTAETERETFALILDPFPAEIGRQTEIIEIGRFQRQERRRRRAAGARARTVNRVFFVTRYGFALVTTIRHGTIQALNIGRNRFKEITDGLNRVILSHERPRDRRTKTNNGNRPGNTKREAAPIARNRTQLRNGPKGRGRAVGGEKRGESGDPYPEAGSSRYR